jgi:hypothetical protein
MGIRTSLVKERFPSKRKVTTVLERRYALRVTKKEVCGHRCLRYAGTPLRQELGNLCYQERQNLSGLQGPIPIGWKDLKGTSQR